MTFEYNPTASAVCFSYKCPECGEICEAEIPVPSPNFEGDNQEDSEVEDEDVLVCEHCGNELEATVITGMYGGTCIVNDLDDDGLCEHEDVFEEEVFIDDYEFDNTSLSYFVRFTNDIEEVKLALGDIKDLADVFHGEFFAKLCYANVIACLEAYLADTFISNVIVNDKTLRQFTETFKDFNDQTVKLNDIYKKLDKHKEYVITTLRELIYHNLPKVKGMYNDALGVDIGEIGDLVLAVRIRHDIVHRNGKDKEGNTHSFDKQKVLDLIDKTTAFVENIEHQVETMKTN